MTAGPLLGGRGIAEGRLNMLGTGGASEAGSQTWGMEGHDL